MGNAFKSFDDGEGHIDGESLRHALMTWGDKFTSKEVDDAFESMVIDSENKSNFLSLYFQCFFSSMLFTKKHLFSFLFFLFLFSSCMNVCCGERRLGPQQDTRC